VHGADRKGAIVRSLAHGPWYDNRCFMVNQERFDSLVRTLATTTGRRQLLAGLAGVAGFLTHLGRGDAFTRCGKPGKKCKFRNGTERRCCPGSRCRRRRCVCTNGRAGCGKKCCEAGQICRALTDVRNNAGFRGFECVTP
jgi:hypothetical protein